MTSYVTPKKNTQFILYVGLVSQANTKVFQSNPTIASGDFKVSTDGGALANLNTLPVVTPASSKMVKITLSSTEMNGDNVTVVCSDASGAEWCDLVFNIQTSARQIDDLAFPNTSGRGMDVDASGGVEVGSFQAGALTSAAFAAGAIDNAAIAADAIGSSELAASAVTEIQSGLALASDLATIAGYIDTEVAAIKAKTDALPPDPADQSALEALIAGITAPTANQNADALLDRADGVESGFTPRQVLRLMAAVLAGKASGMGTTSAVFRDLNDTKDRITATVDADGNRGAVNRDVS